MSNNKTRIYGPAPFDDGEVYKTPSGGIIEVDKYMAAAIDVLRVLDIPELLTVMDISYERVENELKKEKAKLCDKALRYLKKGKWHWPETGEKIDIDSEFCQDFLGQNVTKQTVYRRLKERRMTITEAKDIIRFFKSSVVIQSNPEMEL